MQQTLGLRAPTTPPKETAPEPSTSVPTTPPKETARAQQQCANNAAEGGGDWSTSGTQGHSLATDGGNDGYRLATYGGNLQHRHRERQRFYFGPHASRKCFRAPFEGSVRIWGSMLSWTAQCSRTSVLTSFISIVAFKASSHRCLEEEGGVSIRCCRINADF